MIGMQKLQDTFIQMWHIMYYHPTVMHVFYLCLKILAVFVIPDAIESHLILNVSQDMYANFFTLSLVNRMTSILTIDCTKVLPL